MNIMKDAEVRTTIEKDIQNVLRRSLGFQASGITITIYGVVPAFMETCALPS